MKFTAKSTQKGADVRDSVGKMTLEAESPKDFVILTRIYRHFTLGTPEPELDTYFQDCEHEANRQ